MTLERLNLLIVGLNYWPEDTGSAPYTTGVAEAMAARGANVTVLAGMPYYPGWRVSASYAGRLSMTERHNGVTIHRVRQYVPGRQSAARRGFSELSFHSHLLRLSRLSRPDLILASMPYVANGVLGRWASRRFHVPYGLIIQDLSSQAAAQSSIRGGTRVATILRSVEGRMLRDAAGVGLVADGFRASVEAMGVAHDRITMLPNWSHVSSPTGDRTRTRAELGWDDATQVVLHAGNMGLKQGLEHVVAAARVAEQREDPVRFILMGDGNQRVALTILARGTAAIEFLPPQPADRFMDVLAAADVLLVNERASVVDMSLPSKLTSYFMAGRAVVAATNPLGITAQEVSRSGAGVSVPAEDPESLLAALGALRADPALAGELGANGPRYAAAHLGADAAYDRVERFLEGLLGDAPARTVVGGPVPTPTQASAMPVAGRDVAAASTVRIGDIGR